MNSDGVGSYIESNGYRVAMSVVVRDSSHHELYSRDKVIGDYRHH